MEQKYVSISLIPDPLLFFLFSLCLNYSAITRKTSFTHIRKKVLLYLLTYLQLYVCLCITTLIIP